jgi:hypothetical protein
MASPEQSKYISDLAVKKTKEFKEVKELLVASGIVKDTSETVMQAETIATITDAMTDLQASKFIDVLIAHKTPNRANSYSNRRVYQTIGILEHIKATINGWDFE